MSKLMENDSSGDDMLYSINSDISDIDSDEVKRDSLNDESDSPCESSDDECTTIIIWISVESTAKCNTNELFSVIPHTRTRFLYIADQSNLYRIQTNNTKQSSMTDIDFNCLLEFLFHASVVPLSNKRDYWSKSSRQSMAADAISRDRIMYLCSILHFHDNSIEKDKVEKVQPILEYFNARCRQIVEPENNISIDEQMIP
ncbi:unnamed protein product [Rotaria magnacalcarata]|uniref:PiggyBac transposable element-derived protein domain-containing protein n=2 Tax=Rotaria magnacalcarata TaxID=392030 RepID=A0A816RG68_9BILA|nr:unnamed protein product [Rotaria magnacalcarata]